MCMPCNEEENSHKSYSFEPVDNTIDDEGYPVPDWFFDSFGGSDKEDDETAHYSVPDWYPSDEDDVAVGEWCGTPKEDPVLEERWIKVTNKKVARRRTKKTLRKSTDEPEGSKTHKVTRGNTRDKKLARVHDYKRGKPTLSKPRAKAKSALVNAHSTTEKTEVSLKSSHHHVHPHAKPVYVGGVLQANGTIHGGKGSLCRESSHDLGPDETTTRTKVGRSSRSIRNDPQCEQSRRVGTQLSTRRRIEGPSQGYPSHGQGYWNELERGIFPKARVGTSAFQLIGACGVRNIPCSAPQGTWSLQVDASAEGNLAARRKPQFKVDTQTRNIAVSAHGRRQRKYQEPSRRASNGGPRNDPIRRGRRHRLKWKKLSWNSDANPRRGTRFFQGNEIVGHARDRIQRSAHAHQWPQLVVPSADGIFEEQGRRIWSRQDLPRKAFPLGRHGPSPTWMPSICQTGPSVDRHQREVIELHSPKGTRRGQPPRSAKRFPIIRGWSDEEEMGRDKARGLQT